MPLEDQLGDLELNERGDACSPLDSLGNYVPYRLLEFSDVKSVLCLGAASRRWRAMTSDDDVDSKVWAPRLLTTEFGLGFSGLDTAACAALKRLGCSPRRLCLQSLPWKPVVDGSTHTPFSWRPRDEVPTRLRLDAAQDFVFCEAYVPDGPRDDGTASTFGYVVGRKIIPFEDCQINRRKKCRTTHFDGRETVRDVVVCEFSIGSHWRHIRKYLDIDITSRLVDDWRNHPRLDVRMFCLVEGVVVPIADTCHSPDEWGGCLSSTREDRIATEAERRFAYLNSRLERAGVLSSALSMKIELWTDTTLCQGSDDDSDVTPNPEEGIWEKLTLIEITFEEIEELGAFSRTRERAELKHEYEHLNRGRRFYVVEDGTLGSDVEGFRNYLRHGTIRAQRTRMFVADYLRSDPSYQDGLRENFPPLPGRNFV